MFGRRINYWLSSWFIGAVTLLFLIEEWLWHGLKRAMALIGRLPGLRRLERWIAGLPPRWAAVVFLAPSTLIIPIKLFGVKMILGGHVLRGTGVILAAKLAATALFARVYVLTQPALRTLAWFVRLQTTVMRWRLWAHAQIEAHPLWRRARDLVLAWRAELERRRGRGTRWARRFKAAQRLERMKRRPA